MYAPAFFKAWSSMGHKVEMISDEAYCFSASNPIASFLNKVQERYHYGFFLHRYNVDIIEKVELFKPDFVFLYRCYHVYASTVKNIVEKTIVFSYNNDDPFSKVPSNSYFRHFIEDARYCHLNYVYRKINVEDFKKIGIYNTQVMLPYYREANNFPIECDKDIPISFIGHYENDGRDHFIESLIDAGIPVRVYGDDKWKSAPLYDRIKGHVFPAKRGKEYNETINRSRICLVFFSKLNHDTYTRRCFEIPAARSVMLCEYTDDMNELYPEGECAMYFRNKEDMVKKARYMLNNLPETERIANNAYRRLRELGGSEYDRCQQIINDYQKLCK